MSSFLDRLKKKDVMQSTSDDKKQEQIAAQNKPPEPSGPPAEQLKVDIFQTTGAIIIYAQIAGSKVEDFSVTIEGDGDIVVIKGQRTRPPIEDHAPAPHDEHMEHLLEECSWGKFYRQIILPAEVDAAKTEAKMREGVLTLKLPLKEAHEKGVRIQVMQVQ